MSASGSTTRPASWWARRSLRARLTAAAGLVILVGMAGAAVLLVWRLHSSLLANLANSVKQQVENVAAGAGQGQLAHPLASPGEGAALIQIVDAQGRVLTSSASIEGEPRLFHFDPGTAEPSVVSVSNLPVGEAGASYRAAALRIRFSGSYAIVYAALPTTEINQSVAELTAALAVGVPVITVLLAGVGWLLIGRALRPVESMRRQAAAIPGNDLHRRLQPPPANDELGRLAVTLNGLLERAEAATGQQKRFLADAAHELRNPLAAIQTQLEVALYHADGHDPAVLREILSDTERLSRLTDDLLRLARLDANVQPRRQLVDLDDLVLEQAKRIGTARVCVDVSGVSAGRVFAGPDAMTRVVANLLDNALRHAESRICVALRSAGDVVTLTVADDGLGIAPADRERVFERFTRLDSARSRDAGGSGLGLAIVRDVVASIGGSVRIEDNEPGARFVVTVPAAR